MSSIPLEILSLAWPRKSLAESGSGNTAVEGLVWCELILLGLVQMWALLFPNVKNAATGDGTLPM